jgi:uncharacterized membrane-anchored protein
VWTEYLHGMQDDITSYEGRTQSSEESNKLVLFQFDFIILSITALLDYLFNFIQFTSRTYGQHVRVCIHALSI